MSSIIKPSKNKYTPTFRNITVIVFAVYLLLLIYLTLFSQYFGRGHFQRSINLIPLVTIHRYMISSRIIRIAIINLAGNILAFVPFGLLLPMVRKGQKHFLFTVSCSIAASIAIEMIQYILSVGVSDIDDVILNVIGGILGYCIYKIVKIIANR